MKPFIPAVLIAITALASCTTSAHNPQTYAALQTALQGSPGFRKLVQDKCAMKITSPEQKHMMSLLANVPQDKVQQVVCERVTKAIASGRLTYDDFTQVVDHHRPTVTAIKVLQGR
ncbi:hypothetical protein [Neorhizobium sp. P12A]|jgi:hypothetical protein|uniref:hypothetical protein n=1 Tax=Neorhizobium sp. P12A TaxID=2268027 RepID=UPI0011ECCC47|nr:hypothetical protein [Neorhizobium sp. P12A]